MELDWKVDRNVYHQSDEEQRMFLQKDAMFSPGIEPGTFCVLDRCDNHYTTKTRYWNRQICSISTK